jgi:LAO/AO transport system kinase
VKLADTAGLELAEIDPGIDGAKAPLTLEELVRGVRAGERATLARAITVIESNAPKHRPIADELVERLTPFAGRSLRIGITGVPGVGKSTFIEAFGMLLCTAGHNVAVLAVDPSSPITGGSILGDKTRMETLARHPRCFIRPSPASGALGGVARKTREAILLCEAAGFDIILVETVGVGQSETAVRSMADFFLVLLLAGAGDELQGIKRGIIELADALVVTKADGENVQRALLACAELAHVVHYLTPYTPGWTPPVTTCSSVTGEGIPGIWKTIEEFQSRTVASGHFERNRRAQNLECVQSLLRDSLWESFSTHPDVVADWEGVERDILAGAIAPTAAARLLLKQFGAFNDGENI